MKKKDELVYGSKSKFYEISIINCLRFQKYSSRENIFGFNF